MTWSDGLSQADKDEMILDACSAYSAGEINDFELRQSLARLGLNAWEIAQAEKQHRPKPPENENGS